MRRPQPLPPESEPEALIAGARRRTRRRRIGVTARALVALLGLAGAFDLAGIGRAPPRGSSDERGAAYRPVMAPVAFVAVRPIPTPKGARAVTISDAANGRVERVVLADPWEGMQVDSTAVD